jgi:hypothetical protein
VQKEKGEGVVLGRQGWQTGPTWAVCAREEKEKGLRAEAGPAGKKRERERGRGEEKGFFLKKKFFSNSFFKHSNFNQTKSMHSNHDAQTLIISKLF